MSHFPTDDELREVFDDYSMGDGSLDREEFKRMCYKYYIAPTYKDVDEVFKELDKNSDEKLTFDEVKNYIAANWKPILDSQNQFLEDLQSCRKKDGPITRDELREILQQPGEEALTDEDIDEIFQLIDLNDDNEISVDEISKLLFNIEAVSRAVSRCESRRSRGRKKSRSRSRSSSKGRKRSKSRSKSRDRRRSKSRSKSRDRKRSKSRSKSRDRKRSRSNERKRSGSRGRKRSSSRGSRHSGSAGSRRGGSGHGRGYEISQGVVSGEAETVSEVIVQNAEGPEQSNQEQTEEQKPETNEQSNVNNEQSNQEQVEAQNPETTEQSNVNNEQSNQEAESGNDKKDDTTEQNDAQQTDEKKPEKTEDNSEQKAE